MSSNKQSVKLYTEEQVRTAIRDAYWCCSKLEVECVFDKLTPIELPSDSLCINCDESESTHNICMNCIIKIGKENIQLPSDDEIEQEAYYKVSDHTENPYASFKSGAKWMKGQILNQNK